MTLTVTTLGSCRTWDVYELLEKQGRVKRNQVGVYGYTHSTRDALQAMRSMAGDLTVPADLRPFIVSGDADLVDRPEHKLNDLVQTDLLVVELSSLKLFIFREYFLQLTLTSQRLLRMGPALHEWWRSLFDDSATSGDRQEVISRAGLPPLEAAIVAELVAKMQSPEDVRADMRRIGELYAGPILFVTHYDVPAPNSGQRLPLRARVISAVTTAAAELGYRVYDPSADVRDYATEHGDSMLSAIRDMQHYTSEFIEQRLGERIHAESLAACAVLPRTG